MLPQVAAITGIQVKDYLQALQDDNKIRVEKIGSGNWYWSFSSDEKKAKEAVLKRARDDFTKADAVAAELQMKVDDAGAARGEDDDALADTGKACIRVHVASTTDRFRHGSQVSCHKA